MKLDLTDKLTLERPELAVGELCFPVDNTKDTMLGFDAEMEALPQDASEALLYETGVRHFLGEDAVQKLGALGLSVPGWRTVFLGIMALVQEIPYEEAEARFRGRQS